MKNSIQYIVLSSALLFGSVLYSQSATEVLKKVNQTYEKKAYAMDYTITGYQVDKAVYHYKGQVAKKANKHLSKSDYEITLIDDSYFLHINHDRKIIVVNDVQKQKNKGNNTANIMDALDSIINESNPQLIGNTANGYQVKLPQKNDPNYESIFLNINKNYQLVGVSYFTKTAENGLTKIEITYQNIIVGESISDRYFSKQDYVTITKKNVTAKEQYKTYEIVDQRSFQDMN